MKAYVYTQVKASFAMSADLASLPDKWKRLPPAQEERLRGEGQQIFLRMSSLTGGFYPFKLMEEKDGFFLFESKRFYDKILVKERPAQCTVLSVHASSLTTCILTQAMRAVTGEEICWVTFPKDRPIRGHDLRRELLEKLQETTPTEFSEYSKLTLVTSKSHECIKDFHTVFKKTHPEERSCKRRRTKKQCVGWWYTSSKCLPCSTDAIAAVEPTAADSL